MRYLLAAILAIQPLAYANAACPSASSSGAGSGQFGILNGQIYGPNNQPFVAHGIDVMEGNQPSVAQLKADFPGINFVRLAIYDYASPQSLAAYVNSLTSAGIVVELEDHYNAAGNAGGSKGVIFTGQQLQTELGWYSAVASAFKSNPNVWFGTNNEPSETNSAGQTDPAALSNWQLQTYQAIRQTGNASPVMLEANGWANNGSPVMLQGYNPSDYSQMSNVIWDMHYYGWLTNGSTSQQANDGFIQQAVSQMQRITSAGGSAIPVIVGEYGNSTTGNSIDPNANQVIQAVQTSGLGTVAWAWGNAPADGLSTPGGGLSAFGQQVAAGIAAAASACPLAGATTSATITQVGANGSASGQDSAPASTLSDAAPDTPFAPPPNAPGDLPVNDAAPTVQITSAASGPAITAPPPSSANRAPLNYLSQSSWWSQNPVAAAGEKALCASQGAASEMWQSFCGDAQ